MNVLILYILCGSLALYPLLSQFIAPILVVAFLLAALSVVFKLLKNGLRVPLSVIWWVWLLYSTVYVVWFAVALFCQNNILYIVQDSTGFLLYFCVLPVLFLYVRFNGLDVVFSRFIDFCCIAITALSIALIAGFVLVFGEVSAESMALTNLFLSSVGLNWQIDHNSGFPGLYTYTAHLLLLGIALALHRYSKWRQQKEIFLVLVYLAAIVLDGHRALLISAGLQLAIVGPRLLSGVKPKQRLTLFATATVMIMVLIFSNLDWIQQRFDFTEGDVSTAERVEQIPALTEKIAEKPVLGGGFGTVASYIRSVDRPFSYEVDFLATIMKLGIVGSLIYFGTYFFVLAHGARASKGLGIYFLSAGLPFLFYMGSNGNQAMSTDSAVFHIFLFLLIAFSRSVHEKSANAFVAKVRFAE